MSERIIDETAADRVAIERWESEGGKTRSLNGTGPSAHRQAPGGRSVGRARVGDEGERADPPLSTRAEDPTTSRLLSPFP
jgi:hypothetical protein